MMMMINYYLFKGGSCEIAAFDSDISEQAFLIGLLQNVLLDRLLADQPVNVHVPRLADAVAAVLRLRVHRRVPVRVVKDDRVGARQVDAHAARSSRQNETEYATVGIETFHQRLFGDATEHLHKFRCAVQME